MTILEHIDEIIANIYLEDELVYIDNRDYEETFWLTLLEGSN